MEGDDPALGEEDPCSQSPGGPGWPGGGAVPTATHPGYPQPSPVQGGGAGPPHTAAPPQQPQPTPAGQAPPAPAAAPAAQ